MTLEDLERLGPPVRYTSDRTQAIYLHSCGDETGHFYINVTTGGWKCWKCGRYGFIDGYTDWEGRPPAPPPQERPKPPPLHTIDAQRVTRGTPQYDYLRGRGLSDDDILFYDLRMSKREKYSRQVIFPVYDRGYRGFITRYIDSEQKQWHKGPDGKWKSRTLRYLNSPGFNRQQTIYNYDKVLLCEEIQIAEGIFSAMALGRNAVATFGKDVTLVQLERLLVLPAQSFVVALDGDALSQALDVRKRIEERGRVAKVMFLPEEHDPDSIPTLRGITVKRLTETEALRVRFALARKKARV